MDKRAGRRNLCLILCSLWVGAASWKARGRGQKKTLVWREHVVVGSGTLNVKRHRAATQHVRQLASCLWSIKIVRKICLTVRWRGGV